MSTPTRVVTTWTPIRWLLLAVAVILFVLAAFGVAFGAVSIVPLGLAFFAAAFWVP